MPASSDTVAQELQAALTHYLSWATKKEQDPRRLQQFQDWADAVEGKALANWKAAQAKKPITEMDGFPGLRQAIQEARKDLVFLHDDRAPHGLFVVCKRWYQQQMAEYLADQEVFERVDRPWEDIAKELATGLKRFGYELGDGVCYNYGIWKAKKGKFRNIAGLRRLSKPA